MWRNLDHFVIYITPGIFIHHDHEIYSLDTTLPEEHYSLSGLVIFFFA